MGDLPKRLPTGNLGNVIKVTPQNLTRCVYYNARYIAQKHLHAVLRTLGEVYQMETGNVMGT